MGNYLPEPITKKTTHINNIHGDIDIKPDDINISKKLRIVSSCASSMQGYRNTMEDTHILAVDLNGQPIEIGGIFDGHGNGTVAKFLQEQFCLVLCSNENYINYNKTNDPSDMKNALEETCRTIDSRICGNYPEYIQLNEKIVPVDSAAGTTAIIYIITQTHIFLLNVGDSRGIFVEKMTSLSLGTETTCILNYNGNAYAVHGTIDHKPNNEKELSRIKSAGGYVRVGRVNESLALSRAFGDYEFKVNKLLPAHEQQVIAVPDITVFNRNDDEQFVVLGCDGLWDVFTNLQVAEHVFNLIEAGEHSIALITEELIDLALEADSKDNISVAIVTFPTSSFRSGTLANYVQKRRETRSAISGNNKKDNKETDSINNNAT